MIKKYPHSLLKKRFYFFVFCGFLLSPVYTTAQELIQDPKKENKTGEWIKKTAKQLTWATDDNRWSFRIDPRIGFRATQKFELEDPKAKHLKGNLDWVRLRLRGNMFHPNLSYFFHLGFSKTDFSKHRHFYHALIKWKVNAYTEFWMGQDFTPDAQEFMTPTIGFQLVNRSILSSKINLGFGKGMYLLQRIPVGKESLLKVRLAMTTGENRVTPAIRKHKWQYTGRLEWLPFGIGSYKGYAQSAVARDPRPNLLAGIGLSQNKGSFLQAGNGGKFMVSEEGILHAADFTNFFIDAHFRQGNLSLYTEFNQRQGGTPNPVRTYTKNAADATTAIPLNAKGFNIQTGYMLSSQWEAVGRLTWVQEELDLHKTAIRQYTVGLSNYLYKHYAKIQTDLSYTEEPILANHLMLRIGMEFHL